MKLIHTVFIVILVFFQIPPLLAKFPPSICDTNPTQTGCVYTSSLTVDPCLSYRTYTTTYCIRCTSGSYLTPTHAGQYCSTAATTTDGTTCTLSTYNAAQGAPAGNYKIFNKQNSTDGSIVTYCLDPTLVVTNQTLCSSFVSSATNTNVSQNWIKQSIGCYQCSTMSFDGLNGIVIQPQIYYNNYLGMYVNDCVYSSQTDYNEICPLLQIYDSTQEACVACNTNISMCLQCSDALTCTVCQAGYRPVALTDPTGLKYTACIWNFCGFDTVEAQGITRDCLNCQLGNCLMCDMVINGLTTYQNCTKCQPGYYLLITETISSNFYITTCAKQLDDPQTYDLFVFSSDGNLNPVSTGAGTSFDQAYLFLAQAMNDVYTGKTLDSKIYSSVTANIWVGKGTHHFFFCPSGISTSISTACTNPGMQFNYPQTNNVQIYIKALDCSLIRSYFKDIGSYGSSSLFYSNCLDFKRGEIPEIRIASNHSNFNVTNFAHFENLLFTGVDMLTVDQSETPGCVYSYIPAKKCEFMTEPNSVVADLDLNVASNSMSCSYTCQVDGHLSTYDQYNPSNLLNFKMQNSNCSANTTGMRGVSKCSGSPYHEDYFKTNNRYYFKRHAVLFNLYAFDGINSQTVVTPQLELINCEFKHFLTNTEALINIETDNIVYLNENQDTISVGQSFSEIMLFLGTDSGAVIKIEDSIFRDSKFCKGLIVYRQQQSFTFADTPRILNMTIQANVYPSTVPFINITNSTFTNLGFTELLSQVTITTKKLTKIVKNLLTYNLFSNKGLVLNLQNWLGDIQIQDSLFNQNFYNIPGLMYTQLSTTSPVYSASSVISNSQYYQNSQLYCLGSLLPLMHQDHEFYKFTETFSLLYLQGMNKQTITINNCDFQDNIALSSNIFIDTVTSVFVQKTRFRRNLSYTSANGLSIYNAASVSVSDSYFYNNIGYYMSKGGAFSVIASSQILIQNNKFVSNLSGHKGSALHLLNNAAIQILDNHFENNGPVFSIHEARNSPYYLYLTANTQLTIYSDMSGGKCPNEFAYFESCYSSSYKIQMAFSEGAIFIQALNTSSAQLATVTISGNDFYNNQATPVLNTNVQTINQASCIVIRGNTTSIITQNDFRSHKSDYATQIKFSCPTIYNSKQDLNYWVYSNAPLIKMDTLEATIANNLFVDNMSWQANMQASLLQFASIDKSAATESNLTIDTSVPPGSRQIVSLLLEATYKTARVFVFQNQIHDNNFNSFNRSNVGGMISVANSVSIIYNNTIRFNGNYDYGKPVFYFQNGIQILEMNDFSHLYCKDSCIASLQSSATFIQNNKIQLIIGNSFKLTSSSLILQDQLFNLTFDSIVNAVTNSSLKIYRCQFTDSFSTSSARVLNITDSRFIMKYSVLKTQKSNYANVQMISQTYQGNQPLVNRIPAAKLSLLQGVVICAKGQIWVANSRPGSVITDCQFINLTSSQGTIITAVNSQLVINSTMSKSSDPFSLRMLQQTNLSSVLQFNNAVQGSLIEFLASDLIIQDTQVTNSTVSNSLLLGVKSKLYINNSAIYVNQIGIDGVFSFDNCELVILTNLQLTANNGSQLIKSSQSKLQFDNITISNNTLNVVAISATQSNLSINNTLFDSNTAQLVSNGFEMIQSSVVIRNSVIQNSNSNQAEAGFFNLMRQSNLQILDNTQIKNISGNIYGLLKSTTQSNVTLANNVSVTACSGLTEEAIIFASQSKNFTICQSYFSCNKPQLISASESSVTIVKSEFTASSGNIIQAYMSDLTLTNTQIRDSHDNNTNGHGVNCLKCTNVNITNCLFQNLTSSLGGALSIQSETVQIVGSIFTGNKALSGGAIQLLDPVTALISNNTFLGNQAIEAGGAILYSCQNDTVSYNCQTQLLENLFIQNSAQKGGALKYLGQNFTSVISTFINNTASYANDIGSYPLSLTIQAQKWQYNTLMQNYSQAPLQLIPGHLFPLYITLQDMEGRIYICDNSSFAKFSFVQSQQNEQIIGAVQIASQGSYNFSTLSLQMYQQQNLTIKFNLFNLDQGANAVFLSKPIGFKIQSINCSPGEHFSDELMCLECGPGYYLADESADCVACQINAFCYGGSNIVPRPGYWRKDLADKKFFECPYFYACLGGNQTSPMSLCNQGYKGILCTQCEHNFERYGFYQCAECGNFSTQAFVYIINFLMLFSVICWILNSILSDDHQRNTKLNVYIRIMINHIQIMGIISQISYGWGEKNKFLMWIWEIFSRVPLHVVSPQCLIQESFKFGGSDFKLGFANIIMTSIAPYMIFVLALIFWTAQSNFVQRRAQNKVISRDIKEKLITTMVVVIQLFYPTLLEFTFQTLNCSDEIKDGIRLKIDLSEKCFQGTHLILFIVLAIPSFLILIYVYPIFIYKQIDSVKNKIKEAQFEKSQNQNQNLQMSKILRYITAGFKLDEMNWELIIMYKKTLVLYIIIFAGFNSNGVSDITLFTILLLFICIAAHVHIKPYEDPQENLLDLSCQIVQVETLFIGMFFPHSLMAFPSPLVESKRDLAFCVLLLSYLLIMTMFFIMLRVEVLKWMIKKTQKGKIFVWIQKFLLRLGCEKETTFKKKHLSINKDVKEEIDAEEMKKQEQDDTLVTINRIDQSQDVELNSSRTNTTNIQSKQKVFQQNQLLDDEDPKNELGNKGFKELPQPNIELGKEIYKQPIEANQIKLINKEPQKNKGLIDDPSDNLSQHTEDFSVKNSVSEYTQASKTGNQIKGSVSNISQISALNQRQRRNNAAAFDTDRTGGTSHRIYQNGTSADEIQFTNEKQNPSKFNKRKRKNSSDNEDDIEDDPLGMLTSRSKQLKRAQNQQNQKIIPLQPQKNNFTNKALFNSTFGGTEVKQQLQAQNQVQSDSDQGDQGDSGDSGDSGEKYDNQQITTENQNRLFTDKPEFITSQESNYQRNQIIAESELIYNSDSNEESKRSSPVRQEPRQHIQRGSIPISRKPNSQNSSQNSDSDGNDTSNISHNQRPQTAFYAQPRMRNNALISPLSQAQSLNSRTQLQGPGSIASVNVFSKQRGPGSIASVNVFSQQRGRGSKASVMNVAQQQKNHDLHYDTQESDSK